MPYNKEEIKRLLCLLVDELLDTDEPVIEENIDSETESVESIILDGKMNLAYMPFWNKNNNSLSEYTHISLAFLDINEDGTPNSNEIDKIDLGDYKGKVGLSLGGYTWSNRIMNVLRDDRKRNVFIRSILKYIDDKGYNYISYDLEYPDKDLAESILSETKERINNKGYNIEMCVAIGCWRDFVSPYQYCEEYLDWIEVMFYDDKNILLHGKNCLKQLESYDYPKSKILIGYSLDTNGIPDNEETLKYKESIIDEYGGKMLWEATMKKKEVIEEKSNNTFKDKWNNPYREMRKVRGTDPYDERTTFRGNGYIRIEKGIMTLSGSQPRMYVNTDLQDVKAQVDFMRVGNDGLGWSGGNIGVRSDVEGHSTKHHLAHTYYFRLKHGQQLDFYKEEEHGKATGVIHTKKFNWDSGIWYRMEFKCYNLTNNKIKLEGYINGNLELEYTDTDEKMYNGRGVVFIRNTSINEAKYKNFNIYGI